MHKTHAMLYTHAIHVFTLIYTPTNKYIHIICMDIVLAIFLTAVKKYSYKSYLRKKRFIVDHSLREPSTMVGKAWRQQGREAAGHIASADMERDAGARLTFSSVFSPSPQPREWGRP